MWIVERDLRVSLADWRDIPLIGPYQAKDGGKHIRLVLVFEINVHRKLVKINVGAFCGFLLGCLIENAFWQEAILIILLPTLLQGQYIHPLSG